MSLSNLTAASGPSGTDIVARFHACPPSLLRAVAVHWRRPENHSTFDVLASRVRGVSITHIWKNAGTARHQLSDALQQKICRLMRADYCCLGFELPSACVGTISCPSF